VDVGNIVPTVFPVSSTISKQ